MGRGRAASGTRSATISARIRCSGDIDRIDPGERFPSVIEQAVGSCDALLALIGPTWLAVRDEAASRDQLRELMIDACYVNGLVDDDGLNSVEAKIDSAFKAADRYGPAEVPEPTCPLPDVTEGWQLDERPQRRRPRRATALRRRCRVSGR